MLILKMLFLSNPSLRTSLLLIPISVAQCLPMPNFWATSLSMMSRYLVVIYAMRSSTESNWHTQILSLLYSVTRISGKLISEVRSCMI
ncbi:hypothetical protein C461_11899 [Halorubrum aidingense JCM 13560]|uniref:Uncharacterized protein n=1 Tax=Halorubrum aidingense JCM 13560 TaxID=1230454 RepID=M0P8H7_9EURY|nr:hypothetical protein C461_11899 [Halorubrum aidingense JCM 13560]